MEIAIKKAYEGVESLQFKGMFYRKDIGQKSIKALHRKVPDR